MKDKKEFFGLLNELNGKPVEQYNQIIGDYDFTRYVIKCHPFQVSTENIEAVFSVRIPQTIAEIPDFLFDSAIRKTALEDFLLRNFNSAVAQIETFRLENSDSLNFRNININPLTQSILPRNALVITKEYLELRISIYLPIQKVLINNKLEDCIDGIRAQDLFFEDLTESLSRSLLYCNIDKYEAEYFVDNMDNSDKLRQHLNASGQISFIAEGALLERDHYSDLPEYNSLNSFSISEEIATNVDVPHKEAIKGFGIPNGLTVIMGEVDSGRSALIDAISQGIYNHIPGDGREHCVTVSDAVEIISEPGRSVQNIDISAFVSGDKSMTNFTSSAANSFEAQAASTVEALEAGARVLLFDEETSCPTFLSTDSRINNLLSKNKYTSLASLARQIVDELGVSIIIAGSNLIAEFIPVADMILQVENSTLSNITDEAKSLEIAPASNAHKTNLSNLLSRSRWVMSSSIDPSIKDKDVLIEVDDDGFLQFGRSIIELDDIRQIISVDQIRSIGLILYYAKLRYMDEGYSLREILDLIDRDLSNEGLNALAREFCGNLARPRRYEIAALINRLPSFRVSHVTQ